MKVLNLQGWKAHEYAKGKWKIYPSTADGSIPMTGANVTVPLVIPFPHIWDRICFLSTNAAYLPIYAARTFTLARGQAQVNPANFAEILYYEQIGSDPYVRMPLQDRGPFEASDYNITMLDYVAGNLVFPIIYVTELEAT